MSEICFYDLVIDVNSKEGLAHHYLELFTPNVMMPLLHNKLLSDMLYDYLKKSEMRSFKSNENIHKKEGGSYYVVSANKASSVTL